MKNLIVIGLQWGDEGKGKVIDWLSQKYQHVVRAQGGNNAGHTIVTEEREYKFHLIPSGILYPHVNCYIGAGTVIDPCSLLGEIQHLEKQGIQIQDRLKISPYAHLIFPYHLLRDHESEKGKGKHAIGTTKRGIGPAYTDRIDRKGIRICDTFDLLSLSHKIGQEEIEKKETKAYLAAIEHLHPFVAPVEFLLNEVLKKEEKVLFEGAQGSLLDNLFGTYPYVTSSSTIAAALCAGAGIGPTFIEYTLGVIKGYTTRVGNGPFPTEFSQEEESYGDRKKSREFGTTTGRMRRMGWFDSVLARWAILLNGVQGLAMMKLDVLDTYPEIKICVAYRHQGEVLSLPPLDLTQLSAVEPIYETMPGWCVATSHISDFEQLPSKAKDYIRKLEHLCGVQVDLVSCSPERKQTIVLNPHLFESHATS